MSPVHKITRRYGNPNSSKIDSAFLVISSKASQESSGFSIRTISTLSNWCKRINPLVSLPAEPASLRKHAVCPVNFSGNTPG